MIKNNESKVEITTRNIKYYKDKNYKCEVGDLITINVSNMAKMSHNKVIAICEICQIEVEIPFYKYNKNKERQGYYSCKKCSVKKRENTNFKKYGVKSPFNKSDVLENNRKWMSSDEFKNKSKKSLLKKYGVDSYSKTDSFRKKISDFNVDNKEILKEKRESTCLEKYGYKSILEIPGLKEKSMFEKYGASYSFHIPEIREKIQNINLKKYGHISPFGNEDIKNKIKEKFLYDFLDKESKFYGNIYLINEYKLYKRKVQYHTYKIKSELLNLWDGEDYYDGEYIKDNFLLDKNDPKFPTIDHKISSFFGFLNGIGVKEISNIDNLCFTKRINNVLKSILSEDEFKSKYKQFIYFLI
jgi:hypothetical protein